eukprot:COSAG06_NODE_7382_length_2522_cov_8.904251_1_plen_55_part_10
MTDGDRRGNHPKVRAILSSLALIILKRKDGRGGLPHVLSLLLRFLRVLRVLRKLE